MPKTVDSIVQLLLEIQKGITAMSAEDRILVGDKLALALREEGTLSRYTLCESYHRHVEIKTSVLGFFIAAEADAPDYIPF